MRQLLLIIVMATTLIMMVRCSLNETISSFDGKITASVPPIIKSYPYLPYLYTIQSDSLKWLYDCPPANESQVSLILKGKVKTDSIGDAGDTTSVEIGENHLIFAVETYNGSTPSKSNVVINADGTFFDTILIASSSVPEVILPQNSRIFLSVDIFVSDTIPLINPHSSK